MSTIPALAVYFIGVLFSPNLGVLLNTWDIPLRILLASGVLAIPTTALALCLSSIVHESRYTSCETESTFLQLGPSVVLEVSSAGEPRQRGS